MSEIISKMSFHDGTLDNNKAKELIGVTKKDLFERHGFAYRGAEKHLIDKTRAVNVIDNASFLDIYEYEKEIVLNTYSANDMF